MNRLPHSVLRLIGKSVAWILTRSWIPSKLRETMQVRYTSARLLRRPPGTLLDQAEFRPVLAEARSRLGQDPIVCLEFGTFAGDSLVVTTQEFPEAAKFAFDSFQGLSNEATDDHGSWYEGEFLCPLPVTIKNMNRQGIDPLSPAYRIKFIKGWFSDTCTPEMASEIQTAGPVQFVMIDCDLKSAADVVLSFIEPLLDANAVLVYDDWFSHNLDEAEVGVKASHLEWLSKHADLSSEEIATYKRHGKAFLISRS